MCYQKQSTGCTFLCEPYCDVCVIISASRLILCAKLLVI